MGIHTQLLLPTGIGSVRQAEKMCRASTVSAMHIQPLKKKSKHEVQPLPAFFNNSDGVEVLAMESPVHIPLPADFPVAGFSWIDVVEGCYWMLFVAPTIYLSSSSTGGIRAQVQQRQILRKEVYLNFTNYWENVLPSDKRKCFRRFVRCYSHYTIHSMRSKDIWQCVKLTW